MSSESSNLVTQFYNINAPIIEHLTVNQFNLRKCIISQMCVPMFHLKISNFVNTTIPKYLYWPKCIFQVCKQQNLKNQTNKTLNAISQKTRDQKSTNNLGIITTRYPEANQTETND